MNRRYWYIAILLVFLTPIGLWAEGSAWGEWAADEVAGATGIAPAGMARLAGIWSGIFPDYSIAVLGQGKAGASIGYILSALLGAALIYGLVVGLVRLLHPTTKHS